MRDVSCHADPLVLERMRDSMNASRSARRYLTSLDSLTKRGPPPRQRHASSVVRRKPRYSAASLESRRDLSDSWRGLSALELLRHVCANAMFYVQVLPGPPFCGWLGRSLVVSAYRVTVKNCSILSESSYGNVFILLVVLPYNRLRPMHSFRHHFNCFINCLCLS